MKDRRPHLLSVPGIAVLSLVMLLSASLGEAEAQTRYSLKTEMSGQEFLVTKDTGLGLIRLDPPGGSYPSGTVVTVTANPSMLSTFDAWGGDLSGSSNPTTITMNTNKSISATFSRDIATNKVTLDYLVDGPGEGTVTLNPPGGIYEISEEIATQVTFTAHPTNGSVFSHWGGGSVDHPVYGTNQSMTFMLVDSPVYVVAYFDTSESVSAFNAHGNISEHQKTLPWMGSEVFVRFDELHAFMAFNAPGINCMLMPHQTDSKMIAQWNGMVETHDHDTTEEGFETTMDGGNIYSRIWIESKNEARIVVRYRSAPVNFTNGLAHTQLGQVVPYGPGDHVDEWFTIYPDGTFTREVKVWSPVAANAVPYTDDRIETFFFETQEFLFNSMGMQVNSTGLDSERYLIDDLHTNALNLVKMDGTHQLFSYDPYPVTNQFEWEDLRSAFPPFENANMVIINTKSPHRPFTIGRPLPPTNNWISCYPNEGTPAPPHHVFNEWPVFDVVGEGYIGGGLGHIVITGDSNSWFRQEGTSVSKIYLSGYVGHTTDAGNADYVKDIAWSWLTPASLTETTATPAEVYGYDMAQKAYMVDYAGVTDATTVEFDLAATTTNPAVNPAILINNWGTNTPIVEVDGAALTHGTDFRYGLYPTLDAKDGRTWENVLLVWTELNTTSAVAIKVHSGTNDTDGDGIDDAWELSWFSDLTTANATSDYDADGSTDLHEFRAYTDPKNASWFFGIYSLQPNLDGDLDLAWGGSTQVAYSILTCTNLQEGIWKTNRAGITGSVTNAGVIGPEDTRAFFIKVRQD